MVTPVGHSLSLLGTLTLVISCGFFPCCDWGSINCLPNPCSLISLSALIKLKLGGKFFCTLILDIQQTVSSKPSESRRLFL